MAFCDVDEAIEYAPRVERLPEVKQEALVEDASDWVRSIAPEPEEEDEIYLSRAKRATLRLVEYFAEAGNLTSKGSIAGETASRSFADPDRIEKIIRPVMGGYAAGGSGGASVGYIGTFPFSRG